MPALVDLTGKTFGLWTVLTKGEKVPGCKTLWLCRCSCGVTKEVIGRNLCNGRSSSCGCERLRREAGKTPKFLKGIYRGAKRRCTDPSEPNYHNYGGRGIRFLFSSYDEFYAAMSPTWFAGATLDRVDNNGHYEAGNLRWATMKQQGNNTRNNIKLTLNGKTRNMSEWAEELCMPRPTLFHRLHTGWSVERALTEGVENGIYRSRLGR